MVGKYGIIVDACGYFLIGNGLASASGNGFVCLAVVELKKLGIKEVISHGFLVGVKAYAALFVKNLYTLILPICVGILRSGVFFCNRKGDVIIFAKLHNGSVFSAKLFCFLIDPLNAGGSVLGMGEIVEIGIAYIAGDACVGIGAYVGYKLIVGIVLEGEIKAGIDFCFTHGHNRFALFVAGGKGKNDRDRKQNGRNCF